MKNDLTKEAIKENDSFIDTLFPVEDGFSSSAKSLDALNEIEKMKETYYTAKVEYEKSLVSDK